VVDQAQNLRELIWRARVRAHVIAVTSGKGGVGKTSTSVNLSIGLAERGARVILLDADLGLANVEVLMGLSSRFNLEHVIEGQKRMNEILVRAPGGIELVPGSSGLAKLADMNAAARENVLTGLDELQDEADFIVIDTMAGIGRNAVSFAAAADEVLLVTTPEPSAIVDAYAMLKTIYGYRDDAVVRLMVNMVGNQAQALAVANKLSAVSQQYLGRSLSFLGCIPRDQHVSQAVMQSQPFMLAYPNAPATKYMQVLAGRILHQDLESRPARESFFKRFAQSLGLASNA
jgi:flagellar biosynthesis protein FlhG